ncbi:MAG: carboxypeptidase-like regulatory domain-containing protein, partial [Ignavibacteriales bacterium]
MKLKLYLNLFLLFSISSFAQDLTGYVYELDDENQKVPLTGTNVYWEGTQIGSITDANGFFTIKKTDAEHHHLIVSYIGFQPDTVDIPADQDSIEIILSVNRELKEVVVTGTSISKFIDGVSVMPTEVITNKELLKAACCNLSESFTTNASVDVQFQDAVTGAKQIQLLGLAGTYTQLMFENIPTLKGV